MIAREVLERQLLELGIQELDCEPEFRIIWADMADVISVQYGGTNALKTDFTRTGKRTKMGVYIDKTNSYRRYYVNTVIDGRRQDAYDAVTQTVPCDRYRAPPSVPRMLLAILWVILTYWLVRLFRGRAAAARRLDGFRESTVDRPQFRDAEICKLT
jgi:hypothetical protein